MGRSSRERVSRFSRENVDRSSTKSVGRSSRENVAGLVHRVWACLVESEEKV